MLFERIFNKIFILSERFSKHEQLCYLNEFSNMKFYVICEQLCYLNKFLIKHLSYLNDFSKHEQLCYLNEFLVNFLSYLNDFQNMNNYVI